MLPILDPANLVLIKSAEYMAEGNDYFAIYVELDTGSSGTWCKDRDGFLVSTDPEDYPVSGDLIERFHYWSYHQRYMPIFPSDPDRGCNEEQHQAYGFAIASDLRRQLDQRFTVFYNREVVLDSFGVAGSDYRSG